MNNDLTSNFTSKPRFLLITLFKFTNAQNYALIYLTSNLVLNQKNRTYNYAFQHPNIGELWHCSSYHMIEKVANIFIQEIPVSTSFF